MAMEEQIERDKGLEPWKRCVIVVILGLAGPAFMFYDEGATVEQNLTQAQSREAAARTAFDKASKKKEKIAELSQNLTTTKERLDIATKLLPDEFLIDEILQSTAEIAKDLGVNLNIFTPEAVSRPYADIKYEEMPIKIDVTGNFNKVAVFYDRLVHLDKLVHLRNLTVKSLPFDTKTVTDWDYLSPQQQAKRSGEIAKVQSNAQMIVFRGLK